MQQHTMPFKQTNTHKVLFPPIIAMPLFSTFVWGTCIALRICVRSFPRFNPFVSAGKSPPPNHSPWCVGVFFWGDGMGFGVWRRGGFDRASVKTITRATPPYPKPKFS
jgi:hypothetical protein